MSKNIFKFKNKIWIYSTENSAWHFISVPEKESLKIKENFKEFKKGWGSLPIFACIKNTHWKTSIFPDKKRNEYILPIKKEIRLKNDLQKGDIVEITIKINTEI